jgi:glycosyltransferase involved in cell wall biosynthesis
MEKEILSVVIPGRNQKKVLKKTFDDILEYSGKLPFEIEVIYVDGNSTDGTNELIENYSKRFHHFQSFKDTDLAPSMRGKGAGVKLGMLKSKGTYRMFMDADSSTPFSEIDKLIEQLKGGYDIAMGSRYTDHLLPASNSTFKACWKALKEVLELIFTGKTKSNMTKKKQPWLRQFMSRGGNLAFVMILGQGFADTRCGFKAYNKRAAEIVFEKQTLPGFGFDTEILSIAKKHNLKIIEVPVSWYADQEDTNINPLKDSIKSFIEIFKIRWNVLTGKYN